MTCLITGCWLADIAGSRMVWGDLHQIGETFVFNGMVGENGEAAGQMTTASVQAIEAMQGNALIYTGLSDRDCFERRGVFVIDAKVAYLNRAAKEYVK